MNRYEKGFITKCAEYGIDGRQLLQKMAKNTISDEQGKELLRLKREMDKAKNKEQPQNIDYRARRKLVRKLLSSLVLGTYGAALGGYTSDSIAGGLAGGLIGGGLGYGAGALSNAISDYIGADQMLPTVANIK